MSRLTQDRIKEITDRTRVSAQVKWFREKLKVDVQYDERGPILTEASFELLVEKSLGLGASSDSKRPSVKPRKAA